MDNEMLHCEICVPMDCLGNTAGQLVRCGAILENLRESEGLQYLDAQIPAEQLGSFRKWLEVNTGGVGRLSQK